MHLFALVVALKGNIVADLEGRLGLADFGTKRERERERESCKRASWGWELLEKERKIQRFQQFRQQFREEEDRLGQVFRAIVSYGQGRKIKPAAAGRRRQCRPKRQKIEHEGRKKNKKIVARRLEA
ncbi:hypothetical protein ACOSQ2_010274 [Xanthoceras sorbifolium]